MFEIPPEYKTWRKYLGGTCFADESQNNQGGALHPKKKCRCPARLSRGLRSHSTVHMSGVKPACGSSATHSWTKPSGPHTSTCMSGTGEGSSSSRWSRVTRPCDEAGRRGGMHCRGRWYRPPPPAWDIGTGHFWSVIPNPLHPHTFLVGGR